MIGDPLKDPTNQSTSCQWPYAGGSRGAKHAGVCGVYNPTSPYPDSNRGDVHMMFRAPAPEVYHLLDCPIADNQRWLSVVEYANLVRGLSLKDRLLNDIPLKRMLLGLRLLHKRCHSLHSALEREITDHEELRERFEAASEGVVELKSRLTSAELEVELLQAQCAGCQADLEAARVELAKAPRLDHSQAAATMRRLRSERNELRATLEATRIARDAAELATQRR